MEYKKPDYMKNLIEKVKNNPLLEDRADYGNYVAEPKRKPNKKKILDIPKP